MELDRKGAGVVTIPGSVGIDCVNYSGGGIANIAGRM